MGQYRLSKRNTQRLLADVMGVELSLGMKPKPGAEMAAALAAPTDEATAFLREQDSAHADESGWYEGKRAGRTPRAWIWVFATSGDGRAGLRWCSDEGQTMTFVYASDRGQ